MDEKTVEIITKASSGVGFTGAGGAVFFGMTANEIAAFAGVIIGLIGVAVNFIVQWYWKKRAHELAVRSHELKERVVMMRAIDGDMGYDDESDTEWLDRLSKELHDDESQ